MLTAIFKNLPHRDRQRCSLVCRKWREALKIPQFYTTIALRDEVKINAQDVETLRKSYHPFTHLRFDRVSEFVVDENFNQFCGELLKVKELTFNDCKELDDDTFTKILSQLNVEKVIVGPSELSGNLLNEKFPTVTYLDKNIQRNSSALFQSFPNLQELHTRLNLEDVNRIAPITETVDKCVLYIHASTGRSLVSFQPYLQKLLSLKNISVRSICIDAALFYIFESLMKHTDLRDTLEWLKILHAQQLTPDQWKFINVNCGKLKRAEFLCNEGLTINLLDELCALKDLEYFDFYTGGDQELTLQSKALDFSKMKTLRLSKVPQNLTLLLDSMPNIENLKLDNGILSADDLEKLFTKYSRLKTLEMLVRGVELENCSAFLAIDTLTELHIKSTATDELLIKANKNRRLTKLELEFCNSVSKRGLEAVAKNSPDLESLTLTCCAKVVDDCINVMLTGFPLLKTLRLWGTEVSEDGYELIKDKIKDFNFSNLEEEQMDINGLEWLQAVLQR